MPHPKKDSELSIEKVAARENLVHDYIAEFSIENGEKFFFLSTKRLQEGFGAIVSDNGTKVTLHTRVEIARHRGNAIEQSGDTFAYRVEWPLRATIFNMSCRPWRVVGKMAIQVASINFAGAATFISSDGHQEVDIELIKSE